MSFQDFLMPWAPQGVQCHLVCFMFIRLKIRLIPLEETIKKKNNQHCRPEEKYVFNVFFCFFFKMSFSLFSPQKCLFIDSVLQEVSLVCISEPSVRRTVLQLCKVVVGSGNLVLLENLCCSLLQSYLLVSLIKKITIRIFNLRSWGQDVVFFFFF